MTDLELVLSVLVFGVLMYFCPSLLSDERKSTLNEFKCHCDAENSKCPKKRIPCRRMIFGNKNAYGKKNARIRYPQSIWTAPQVEVRLGLSFISPHAYFSRTSVHAQITRPAITLSQSPA